MKILQVAHYFGPLGGIERVVDQFCRALQDHYDVEVLACKAGFQTEETVEEGIPVTRVGRLFSLSRMSVSPTFPAWLRKKNPDLVHLHMSNPMAEASFLLSGLKCKVVATYHMDITRQRTWKLLYDPIQKRFIDRLEFVTASSENFAKTSPVLSKHMDKVKILPFGLSESRFDETERTREKARELEEGIRGGVVLFVGRLIHYKGLDILIEAMKNVGATCLIVGTGYLKEELQSQIDRNDLREKVRLIGRVSDEELLAYYDRADVFVLPSTSRTESFGLTQLEAMSRGTPVICTDVGTGTTFVNRHEETGLVVPSGDPGALAAAMSRILSDEGLRARLSQGALERRKSHFSEKGMVDRLLELYREVLA